MDFEIVFGRRQVASTGLVLIVVLACFSGVSYLIGRSAGAKTGAPATATAVKAAEASTAVTPAPVTAAPVKAAAVTAPPAIAAPDPSKPQAPLFAEAISGKVYIQVGAIDKGLAGIWAEGLRAHGLDAFVSTGPSDKMWRVLIGPLPDPQSHQHAKDTLDSLGIATFGRKYSDQPAAAAPKAPAQ